MELGGGGGKGFVSGFSGSKVCSVFCCFIGLKWFSFFLNKVFCRFCFGFGGFWENVLYVHIRDERDAGVLSRCAMWKAHSGLFNGTVEQLVFQLLPVICFRSFCGQRRRRRVSTFKQQLDTSKPCSSIRLWRQLTKTTRSCWKIHPRIHWSKGTSTSCSLTISEICFAPSLRPFLRDQPLTSTSSSNI